MSAYGALTRHPSAIQAPTLWKTKLNFRPKHHTSELLEQSLARRSESSQYQYIVAFHHTLSTASLPQRSGLLEYLHAEFADEVERGLTYPQETQLGERLTREAFEAYFFAADVIVGLSVDEAELGKLGVDVNSLEEGKGAEVQLDFDEVRAGREWAACVAGFYYIKPNYPGRSSHICNAGFVVPFAQRGRGNSTALARSYLHYGPKLGYQASVFNLVYVNNAASVRIWENLGFTKAGRIPRAGRLKRKDGRGEEYVDAWIFYKSFTENNDA